MNTQAPAKPRVQQQAPAVAESKGQVAVQDEIKITPFERELNNYMPQIQAVLPSHIRPEQFKRVVTTAVNLNQDLILADRRTLFNSCVKAANDGLLPDGREGALVIFNTKTKQADGKEIWVKAVQWMPMIYGIRKRMRNSGEVKKAVARVVCEQDDFDYILGDEERIEHKMAKGDRGDPIGAYAIITLADGEKIHEYMNLAEIEEVRAVSKAPNSLMWSKFWGEGARKVVLRRCSKAAPMSSELERVLSRGDGDEDDADPFTISIGAGQQHVDRPRRDDDEKQDEKDERPEFPFITGDGEVKEVYHRTDEFAEHVQAFLKSEADDYRALWDANAETVARLEASDADDGWYSFLCKLYSDRAKKEDEAAAAAKAEREEAERRAATPKTEVRRAPTAARAETERSEPDPDPQTDLAVEQEQGSDWPAVLDDLLSQLHKCTTQRAVDAFCADNQDQIAAMPQTPFRDTWGKEIRKFTAKLK